MWNVNAVLWTPGSQVASNAARSSEHELARKRLLEVGGFPTEQ